MVQKIAMNCISSVFTNNYHGDKPTMGVPHIAAKYVHVKLQYFFMAYLNYDMRMYVNSLRPLTAVNNKKSNPRLVKPISESNAN